MHIHCVGLNHQTSSVTLRERLAFSPQQLESALLRVRHGNAPTREKFHELVILSTCNRVEIYAVASKPAFKELERLLAETHHVPVSSFRSAIYRWLDGEAVMHLLRVTAGLDSLVLGEPQILGQVTEAYSAARKYGSAGKTLSRVFQAAIHAGKRIRSETSISRNPASIASVAVKIITKNITDLPQARVCVLGTGEMAQLALQALRKRGVHAIDVVSRTLSRAEDLADSVEARAYTYQSIPTLLIDADILISSTAAPHAIISPTMVLEGMQQRQNRPLVIMDIAVPRDVDARVADIPGVTLFDMDTIADSYEVSLAKREAEKPKSERILVDEYQSVMHDLSMLKVVPIIVQMREQAEAIRQAELEKTLQRMPDISPELLENIDILTKSLVKKILHKPTIRLKEEAEGPAASKYARITRGLFGID